MDKYLDALLAGQIDMQAALAWLESDSDTDAPGAADLLLVASAESNSAWGRKLCVTFRPAQLRAFVLDHARTQAAPMLQAGEPRY